MIVRTLLAGSFLVATAAPAIAAAVNVTEQTLFGRPVTVLDNGLVRLAVTPELGGRVLAFRLFDGASVANVREDNIGKDPDDPDFVGAEYGGFSDAATSGWPGPFWGVDYDLRVERDTSNGAATLVAVGEAGGMRIERRMTLEPGRTSLRLAMTQRNTGEVPKQMTLRLHSEMAAGALADNADRVSLVTEAGFEVMPVVIGAEYARFRWMTLAQPWLAVVDAEEQQGVVRRFVGADAPKVFYWVGYNESPETLGRRGAFFSLDWFAREATVEPGDSLQAVETMFLFDGLSKVGLVHDDTAAGLTADREVFAAGETARLTAGIASAEPWPGGPVELTISREGEVLHRDTRDLPEARPGQAATTAFSWPIGDVSDGPIAAEARFLDDDGDVLGRDRVALTLDTAKVRGVDDRLEAIERRLAELREAAERNGLMDRLDVPTELRVIEARRDGAGELREQGRFDAAAELADVAIATADRLDARIASLSENRP